MSPITPAPKASRTVRSILIAICAVTWIGAFTATHLPPGDVPAMGPSDKVLHLAGYAVLATPLMLTLAALGRTRRRRIVFAVTVLLIYGIVDELTQPIFGRSAAIGDWLCDAAGTIGAVIVWEIVFALRRGPDAPPNIGPRS